jgi:nitrous oxidase accessory protein NosD
MGHRPAISRDTIIEENSISDAPVGIALDAGFEGVIIRRNRFERVRQDLQRTQG